MNQVDNIIQQAREIQKEIGAKDFAQAIEILKSKNESMEVIKPNKK